MDAECGIWIVSDPRPEHTAVVNWLNGNGAIDFYLLKLEAVQIGGSPAAPLRTLIVGPSEETRALGQTRKEMSERHRLRYHFFEGLLEYAKKRTQRHANVSPGKREGC